jgi:hypothetical protein
MQERLAQLFRLAVYAFIGINLFVVVTTVVRECGG